MPGYPPVARWPARRTIGAPPEGTCTAPASRPRARSAPPSRAREGGGPAGDVVAPAQRDVTAGRHDEPTVFAYEAEREADDLEGGRSERIPDERVGSAERERVHRPRRGDPIPQMREAARVLDRRAGAAREDADHRARNRTRSPARISTGGSRSGSKQRTSVRPMSRQPPGESSG